MDAITHRFAENERIPTRPLTAQLDVVAHQLLTDVSLLEAIIGINFKLTVKRSIETAR
jgi:hypothetical protein